ncbi:MAG: ferrochelatase [Elusimicrobia bacterium]|nr:ferrochelatase [Elusimicrobiota bacterium]
MKAVVLAGFGGPERRGDVRPFLEGVLRGRAVPPHRIDEVVGQYEQIGGRSPYNDLARSLAAVLGERFRSQNVPVTVGMRNGSPTMADTLADLKNRGVTDVVVVVLAAYRSIPSWNYYLQTTAQAIHGAGRGLRVRFVAPYHGEDRFVGAVSARIQETLDTIPTEQKSTAQWIFTAHSIPELWDKASGYSHQVRRLCERVVSGFGQPDWQLVYQSRSGRPEDPWLEPDINDWLKQSADMNGRAVMVVPVGFIMDHVEVVFDLDIKVKKTAESVGAIYYRAKTVGEHPLFIDLLQGKIQELFV